MNRAHSAVVTAGNSGIGRAIVRAFALEGISVVFNFFDRVEEADDLLVETRPLPGDVVGLQGDMTSSSDAQALVARAVERFGGVDILVNNAGGGDIRPFTDMTREDWDHVVGRNLTATFVVTRAVLETMLAQGSGRIINISSQMAFKGAPNLAHYCAAKAGVVGMTRALALELASYGILVNSVAPGPIDTPGHGRAGVSPQHLTRQVEALPLHRLGRPEEVAASVLFLAKSPSGDFYTGQTLHPNGGDVMPLVARASDVIFTC